jgi:hypothetical protein
MARIFDVVEFASEMKEELVHRFRIRNCGFEWALGYRRESQRQSF